MPAGWHRRRELQIAHSTTDLPILGIPGGLPECAGHLVVEGNQCGHPTCATAAQVLLTCPRQRDPDALPPKALVNDEPVHVPPPSIPAGNQGADDLAAALSDQKGGRGISDQALDVIEAIGSACVLAPRLGPQP